MKQLCRKREKIPENLLKAKDDALSQSTIGTEEHFLNLIEKRSSVFIIFDALDECPEQDRKAVIRFITSVLSPSITRCVKVFVTSRREMDIAEAFESLQTPTIQVQVDKVTPDIATYTQTQVKALRLGQHGQRLYISKDELVEKVITALATKADGMLVYTVSWATYADICQVSLGKSPTRQYMSSQQSPQGLIGTRCT